MKNPVNSHASEYLKYAAIGALPILPLFLSDRFQQHVLVITLIYVIVLIGLNIVTGLSGQVSLCQAAFYGVGAYVSAILVKQFDLSFWISMPLAACATGAVGFFLSACTVKMRTHYLALATIGFGEIITNFFRSFEKLTGGANGLSEIPSPAIGNWKIDTPLAYYYLVLVITVIAYTGMMWIVRSRLGNAFLAVRENELAAASLGLNTVRLKVAAFTLGALYAGVAGALYAHFDGFIGPESFSTSHSILLLCVLVVGGSGRPWGAIPAAILFVVVQEFFRAFSQYQLVLFGVTVILVMIFAPSGLVGFIERSYKWIVTAANIFPANSTPAISNELEIRDSTIDLPATDLNGGGENGIQNLPLTEIISAENITVKFGGVTALDKISFKVNRGEILCLIGPNGAGKTTLLNVLGGQVKPEQGNLFLHLPRQTPPAQIISLIGRSSYKVARLGLARTFQTSQLFYELTALNNVVVGTYINGATKRSALEAFIYPKAYSATNAKVFDLVDQLLHFAGLHKYRNQLAKQLPFGLRRALEIDRSLATGPEILLLDEPSSGMNLSERQALAQMLREARLKYKITLVIVAHDLSLVRSLADRVIVLDQGKVIFTGPPEDLDKDFQVISAYLGMRASNYASNEKNLANN